MHVSNFEFFAYYEPIKNRVSLFFALEITPKINKHLQGLRSVLRVIHLKFLFLPFFFFFAIRVFILYDSRTLLGTICDDSICIYPAASLVVESIG